MSRNGSGTYTLPAGNPVVTGTTITTTWANTTLNDVASSLTGSVAADGQTPMSGSLNMANNKIISVLDPTLAQDAATKAYVDASVPSTANFLTKTNNLSDVTSVTTSRTNLLAAQSGANSDITSITGLTTALSVGQGGTGLTAPGTSGNILTSNGTIWTSTAASNNYVGVKGQVFTANGTFTIPANITALKITVTGGGSGGNGSGSIGGGAGGTAISYLTGLTPANTLAVTVGAGGAGSSGTGTAGGNSTVASGTQTITTITGSGGANTGVGGSATNGTINITGGGVGQTATSTQGSVGGSSFYGGAGAGSSNAVGGNGSTGGGGGGGGGSSNAGGTGGTGIVVFEW